jgi:hypothetical protein
VGWLHQIPDEFAHPNIVVGGNDGLLQPPAPRGNHGAPPGHATRVFLRAGQAAGGSQQMDMQPAGLANLDLEQAGALAQKRFCELGDSLDGVRVIRIRPGALKKKNRVFPGARVDGPTAGDPQLGPVVGTSGTEDQSVRRWRIDELPLDELQAARKSEIRNVRVTNRWSWTLGRPRMVHGLTALGSGTVRAARTSGVGRPDVRGWADWRGSQHVL